MTHPWCWCLSFSGHRLVVLLNYRSGLEVDQRADRYQPERVSDFQLLEQRGPGCPQLCRSSGKGRGGGCGQAPSSPACSAGTVPGAKQELRIAVLAGTRG